MHPDRRCIYWVPRFFGLRTGSISEESPWKLQFEGSLTTAARRGSSCFARCLVYSFPLQKVTFRSRANVGVLGDQQCNCQHWPIRSGETDPEMVRKALQLPSIGRPVREAQEFLWPVKRTKLDWRSSTLVKFKSAENRQSLEVNFWVFFLTEITFFVALCLLRRYQAERFWHLAVPHPWNHLPVAVTSCCVVLTLRSLVLSGRFVAWTLKMQCTDFFRCGCNGALDFATIRQVVVPLLAPIMPLCYRYFCENRPDASPGAQLAGFSALCLVTRDETQPGSLLNDGDNKLRSARFHLSPPMMQRFSMIIMLCKQEMFWNAYFQ